MIQRIRSELTSVERADCAVEEMQDRVNDLKHEIDSDPTMNGNAYKMLEFRRLLDQQHELIGMIQHDSCPWMCTVTRKTTVH